MNFFHAIRLHDSTLWVGTDKVPYGITMKHGDLAPKKYYRQRMSYVIVHYGVGSQNIGKKNT